MYMRSNSDERPKRTRGSYKKTCPYGINCKFFNVARGCKGSDVCRRFQKSRKRQIALVARASVAAEERRECHLVSGFFFFGESLQQLPLALVSEKFALKFVSVLSVHVVFVCVKVVLALWLRQA